MVHICNGILISYNIRQNATIYDSMDRSWEYHAKQNKADRRSWETYDFTYIWYIKPKAINKQRLIDTDNSMVLTRGEALWGEAVENKWIIYIYGDWRRQDF
mgnify:CR=1 FL=1